MRFPLFPLTRGTVLGQTVDQRKLLLDVGAEPFAAVGLSPLCVEWVGGRWGVELLPDLPIDPVARQDGGNDFRQAATMCNRQKMPGVGLRDGCPLGVGPSREGVRPSLSLQLVWRLRSTWTTVAAWSANI